MQHERCTAASVPPPHSLAVAYWIAGLRANAASFFFFYFGTLLLALFWLGAGVAYSAIFPVLPIAQIVGGLSISTTFLFAGLFIPGPKIPDGWKGLYYAVSASELSGFILGAIPRYVGMHFGGTHKACDKLPSANSYTWMVARCVPMVG